jgi:hypothetical protein
MSYLKKNSFYILISLFICMVILVIFTSIEENKSRIFVEKGEFRSCGTLRFSWLAKRCWESILEERALVCSSPDCSEQKELAAIQSMNTLSTQLSMFLAFLLSVVLVADYVKKVLGEFNEDAFISKLIARLRGALLKKNLSSAKTFVPRGWRFELTYFFIFVALFSLIWGVRFYLG